MTRADTITAKATMLRVLPPRLSPWTAGRLTEKASGNATPPMSGRRIVGKCIRRERIVNLGLLFIILARWLE
jgi:hypothetical protein